MKQKIQPRVFVSYSWDSDEHKEKVRSFVQNLRISGVEVVYDGDLQLGERLQHFMESSIPESDIVLFVCTPNYKHRADNRISGVGYESGIITSELYEMCNEKKFIPVLFTGTWETSLPIWAKGKLGVDLSSQDSYEANYKKLIKHLLNDDFPEDKVTHQKKKEFTKGNDSGISKKIATTGKSFFDINRFRGLVLVAVIASLIWAIIEMSGTLLFSNLNTSSQDDSLSDSSSNIIIGTSNGISSDDSGSKEPNHEDSISNKPNSNSPSIDDFNDDDPFGYLDDLEDLPESNGTLPKGTNPVYTKITEETKKQLSFIQELVIGSSKKWIDDALGLPFVERRMSVKDDRLMYPADDESSKTGEILVCGYNISDVVMVQTYYDITDNSCQAFFVTLLDDFADINIAMPEIYSSFVSNKSLGEFAFSEIDEGLECTFGYAGQGVGRTFYGEEYYYAGRGNYKNFYFAVLDYGMLNSVSDFSAFLSIFQFYTGHVNNAPLFSEEVISQREKFYPNTYGISTLNNNLTFDLLGNYSWFDSLPLRDRNK